MCITSCALFPKGKVSWKGATPYITLARQKGNMSKLEKYEELYKTFQLEPAAIGQQRIKLVLSNLRLSSELLIFTVGDLQLLRLVKDQGFCALALSLDLIFHLKICHCFAIY